jgi:hypothetical protein
VNSVRNGRDPARINDRAEILLGSGLFDELRRPGHALGFQLQNTDPSGDPTGGIHVPYLLRNFFSKDSIQLFAVHTRQPQVYFLGRQFKQSASNPG